MISLPTQYQPIRQKLEQHLLENPQDAARLAIAHYEDFLALKIRYRKQKADLLLIQSQAEKKHSLSLPNISLNFTLPLECQFFSERLKRYLRKNPGEAHEYAIAYYEDFIILSVKYKKLFLKTLEKSSPSLPSFL